MPIAVVCPQCAAKLNAPDAAAGKKVKCPKCQSVIVVPQPIAAAAAFEVVDDEPVQPKKPVAKPRAAVKATVEEDDEEDAPRKKRRDQGDDDDDQPKKKKKKKAAVDGAGGVSMARNIVMGVLLIVLIGVAAYVFYDRSQKQKDADAAPVNKSDEARAANPAIRLSRE